MHPFIEKVNALAVAIGNSIQLRGFKTGGIVGQVPTKNSNTDFDWGWGTPVVAGSMTQAEITGAITNKVTFASDNGLQVAGSYVTLTGVEALTNKTFSNCTFPTFNQNTTGNAATVSGLSFSAGKTLTVSNSLTLAGTDGSTLNFGTGGTLGTAAFTNSNAYATAAQGTDERVPSLIGLSSKFSTEDAAVLDNDRIAIFDSNDTFAPKHALFSTLWTWIKSKLSQISGTFSVGGAWAFTHTLARPTSAGTPTLAGDSLITLADGMAQTLLFRTPVCPPSAEVAFLPLGFGRLTGGVGYSYGSNDTPATMLPFCINAPFTKVSVNHTAGYHPSAVLEIAIYLPDATGKPHTLLYEGSIPFSTALGHKTWTTPAPVNIKGLFYIAMRPSIGITAWAATGGTGSATLMGVNPAVNYISSFLFGNVGVGAINAFGGSLLLNYCTASRPFPATLPAISTSGSANLVLGQTASGGTQLCAIHM